MPYRTKSFEVKLDSPKAIMAFGIRMAVADWIRDEVARRIDTADSAGIDRQTAVQRFGLEFAGCARGYRLPRAIPPTLVQWAGFVEFNKGRGSYPTAAPHSIGSFGLDHVQSLPGDVVVVKLGGISFAGVAEGGLPGDICEVRVAWTPDGYMATVVAGRPDGDDVRLPVPQEPETQDA